MNLRFALLLVAAPALLATACSSSSQGDVACQGTVCDPKPIFATGFLSTTLVTSDAVYVAESASGAIYAADKPFRTARLLTPGGHRVGAFARTSRGLYWTTPPVPQSDKTPPTPGMLSAFGEQATSAVTIDAKLDNLGTIAAIDDTVYVAVQQGILRLAPDATALDQALSTSRPYALRAYGGALYWHNGLDTIFTWRPGDTKPTTLVEHADVVDLLGGTTDYLGKPEPFAVDASGIYWIKESLIGGGTLEHAPLAGGAAAKLLDLTGYPETLALGDDAVYWTEADSGILPTKTTIKRSPKSAPKTSAVVAVITGDARGLQVMPEGLYIGVDPSFDDYDVMKLKFTRFAGPLLFLPKGVLGGAP